jgi:uncharacterized protein (DUF58 family)
LRLTRLGIQTGLLYAALIGAFFATPYSNLFFLMLGFLTLQWVLGAAWSVRNVRGVHVTLPAPEPMPAGAGQLLQATLEVPARTRFQLVVELELDGGQRVAAQADMLQGVAEVVLQVPALPRGVHGLRRARVRSSYPLGLLEARRRLDAPRELVVYPAPSQLVAARSAHEALAEALGSRGPGRGEVQPASLREHRPGDELRAVHWRASARRGALVVREWEGGAEQGLELLIDRRCEAEALEQALSLASAVVELARTHKETLRIHSQGLQATFGPGHHSWNDVLHFLAAAQPLPADGPAPPTVSPSTTRLPLAAGHAG